MHLIGSTNTVRYSRRAVFVLMALTCLVPMQQFITSTSFEHLALRMGTPDGLCSSITESKHIKVVKEPWRRSSHWEALKQMLTTNSRLDKLSAARVDFASCRILKGSVLKGVLSQLGASCTVSRLLSNPDILNLTLRYPR